MAERVRKELGDPSIVVTSAGLSHAVPFTKETALGFSEMVAVNLHGTFLVVQAFLPAMLKRKQGRIVCIASIAGKVGFKYTAAYCASKHGVLGLVRSLALETAERGVTVNAVCPGWTDTAMVDAAAENIAEKSGMTREQAVAALADMSPQKRLMTPLEVAQVGLFFCSDEAAGINGQAWNIDGGEVMS